MPLQPIASCALLTIAAACLILTWPSPARPEEPGLEADYCYPTRDAAMAAFGNGQTVIVEGQILLDRSGKVETFEILTRSGDSAAVLLNSQDQGEACILIRGRIPSASASTASAPVTYTKSGPSSGHATSPRSATR